jgi:hypothetical protein
MHDGLTSADYFAPTKPSTESEGHTPDFKR